MRKISYVVASLAMCLAVCSGLTQQPGDRPAGTLPHAIADADLAAAFARFDASVPMPLDPVNGSHQHFDVHLVDVNGNASDATVDRWQLGPLVRTEQHAPGWSRTLVRTRDQEWNAHEGVWPMRLLDLAVLVPRPQEIEHFLLDRTEEVTRLKPETTGGKPLRCATRYAVQACFDEATGFILTTGYDGEDVRYLQWNRYRDSFYPSHVTISAGSRLQADIRVKVFTLPEPGTLFDPLPGVEPIPLTAKNLGAFQERHPILKGGYPPPNAYNRTGINVSKLRVFGVAEVKVAVDAKGLVTSAVLVDADTKLMGELAVASAKDVVYEVYKPNGVPTPFQSVLTFRWHSAKKQFFPPTGSDGR